MSNYTRQQNFTAKDALLTGNPAKVIKGSEVDSEFDELVTVSATKIDKPASPSAGDVLEYNGSGWDAKSNAIMPVGTVVPYAGSTAPGGWLLCDGSDVSQTTYADLFAVIGTTYGAPGGGDFTLPDLRGRAVFGKDNMGGSAANRVTSGSAAGIDGTTLGATGGDEEHAITEAELALHGHPWRSSGDPGDGSGNGGFVTDVDGTATRSAYTGTPTSTSGQQIGGTGSGDAHNNMSPTIILNYIIFADA